MSFDFLFFITNIGKLLPYIGKVLNVLFFSILFGTILGSLVAFAKLSKIKILKNMAYGYTTILRCTPSIVLLFIIYYGFPEILSQFGINSNNADKEIFIVITFALFCSASLSEVMRSAYESINKGQFEAAVSVGMKNIDALRRIILPQVFHIILPPFGNTVIAVLKEGSLGFTIGFIDLIGRANIINNKNLGAKTIEIYIAVALIYWGLSIIIERIIALLEKYFSKYKLQY